MSIFSRSSTGFLACSAGMAVLFAAGFTYMPARAATVKEHTVWHDNEGSNDAAEYSALKQIDKSNVSQLKQVWFYPASNGNARFGSNPLVVDKMMFVIGKNNSVAAVDATTGKEIWLHDNGDALRISDRGMTYWESKDRSDRRILYTANNVLHALDARTGKSIDSFGNHGGVDLRDGLGRDFSTIRQIQSATPGRIFENLLIMGSATGEEYGSPPGDIRAYDVITGKMVWIFHTVPHPGEPGYDTWPKDAWKYIGGVNDWGGMAIDDKRGIGYFPLGSPTYDFFAADRPGSNLYSDSLLALDIRTGKYLWHYQVVHHDLWDYDLTTSPKLLTVKHDGKNVDVVAQAGKTGFLYVFDRVTGKPLWPIEERPVPPSDLAGQNAWPTQPFPTAPPPFARQKMTADDINPYITDPAERKRWHDMVQDSHNALFMPPDLINTLEIPGNAGGANWGMAAADPATGFVYVISKDAPTMLKLEPKPPRRNFPGPPPNVGRAVYIQNCQVCHTPQMTGQPPVIPSLVGIVGRIGADRIRAAVTNGLSPMPAFTDLTPREIDSLITFLTDPSAAHLTAAEVDRLEHPAPLPPVTSTDPAAATRYWSGYGYMNAKGGLPAITPPWSTLTAYDLNKGTIKWQVPFGGVTELIAKGITNTGAIGPRGGVAVTAGGLIFAGTNSDSSIRAYDKDSGKVLWETTIPGRPEGVPTVFEIDGQEYVAFGAVGAKAAAVDAHGNAIDPTTAVASGPETQGYYVFALPKK